MDDFEFQDWYEFHVDNEPECDVSDFPDDIGQDMSEYEGDLTTSEGDYSDIFDLGDEIVDDDGDYSDCE